MSWFSRKAPQPPADSGWIAPISFSDWTEAEIAAMSKVIRVHDQPDSEGWRRQARICLNAMRGRSAVEMVARVIEDSLNPGLDPDRPIQGSHYMHGRPHWCVWVEDARPAVYEIINRWRESVK